MAVLYKTLAMVLVRTAMQPVLLIFVFTYVFPRIGQGVGGGGERSAGFSTLLVAGVVGLSVIFTGIQAVALPLVNEFGYTKEIEDRILAPLPVWAVAVEKIEKCIREVFDLRPAAILRSVAPSAGWLSLPPTSGATPPGR